MPQELELVGTPIRVKLQSNELARFLATQAPDLPVFEYKPRPGVIMGAAFDWVAVLGTTADLIAIGGALWATYEYVVKKRSEKEATNSPMFLVQVKTRSGTFVQFTIEQGQDREVFVQEFTQVVSSLQSSAEGNQDESLVEHFESSETLVRVRNTSSAPTSKEK
jgi:hypothetical protein